MRMREGAGKRDANRPQAANAAWVTIDDRSLKNIEDQRVVQATIRGKPPWKQECA